MKKQTKRILYTTALVIILLMIIIGIFIFLSSIKKQANKLESTSSDGLALLSIRFYDQNGNIITNNIRQAVLGSDLSYIYYFAFDLKGSNPGTINVYNVKPTNPSTDMGSIFSNQGSISSVNILSNQINISVRSSDQSCTTDANCDTNEKCIGTPLTCKIIADNFISGTQPKLFKIALIGDNYDANGVLQTGTTISNQVNINYTFLPDTMWCYQESANISTACGGLNTGKYWTSTYLTGNVNTSWGYFNMNYSVPSRADTDSTWKISFGQGTYSDSVPAQNYSIPPSCFNYYEGTLMLRVYSRYIPERNWQPGNSIVDGVSTIGGQCFDGEWQNITETKVNHGVTSVGGRLDQLWYDGLWNRLTGAGLNGNWWDNSLTQYGFTRITSYTQYQPGVLYEEAMNWHIQNGVGGYHPGDGGPV